MGFGDNIISGINDLVGIKDTRLFDPLAQKSFQFLDITNVSSAVWSSMISATQLDMPNFEIELETITPINRPIKQSFYKTSRPGDLTITRGNFSHDLYSYNSIISLMNGEDYFFPRKDFLVIHTHSWRPLIKYGLSEIVKDTSDSIENTANYFLAAVNMQDGLLKALNNPIPSVVYLMKDCLLSGITLNDGFDASSNSISFGTMSFSVGELKMWNGLEAVINAITYVGKSAFK